MNLPSTTLPENLDCEQDERCQVIFFRACGTGISSGGERGGRVRSR